MGKIHVYEVTRACFIGGVLRTPDNKHKFIYRDKKYAAGEQPDFLIYRGVKGETKQTVVVEDAIIPPKKGETGELAEGDEPEVNDDDGDGDDADGSGDGDGDDSDDDSDTDTDGDTQGDTLGSQSTGSKIDDLADLNQAQLLEIANGEPLLLGMAGNSSKNNLREAIRTKRVELDL